MVYIKSRSPKPDSLLTAVAFPGFMQDSLIVHITWKATRSAGESQIQHQGSGQAVAVLLPKW